MRSGTREAATGIEVGLRAVAAGRRRGGVDPKVAADVMSAADVVVAVSPPTVFVTRARADWRA